MIVQTRSDLLADDALRGLAWCRAWTPQIDRWLAALFGDVFGDDPDGLCLMAVGGFGRGLLAPQSDLDVVLVHAPKGRLDDVALRALWYPIWDSGLRLGHAVRSANWSVAPSTDDLDSVTALLDARPLAGDAALGEALQVRTIERWRKDRAKWLPIVRERSLRRHHDAGEVAFMLEPDLKEGRGGLRDVNTVGWLTIAGVELDAADSARVDAAESILADVRVALHRVSLRQGDVIRLDDQDEVANRAGFVSATAMLTEVASSARDVAWVLDKIWEALDRAAVKSWPLPTPLASGVMLDRGEVHLGARASVAADPTLVLRLAVASARAQRPIARDTLARAADELGAWPDPWPPGAVDDLVALLLEGHRAIPAWEALDHAGLVVRMLPEWAPVRARPQRNLYHRFTVDRHLWEAAAEAAALVGRVQRPDLLMLGTLFHDLGKGYSGDHSEAGVALLEVIGPRLGLPSTDTSVLMSLARLHLLLPDVATRRDLGDPETIAAVAAAVGDVSTLDLLAALTEADSLATGPTAWSEWKAELMAGLVERVRHVLGGGAVADVTWRLFPTGDVLARMGAGELWVDIIDDQLVAVSRDVPGTLSRVAGALALHDLDVVWAQAHSDEQGMAASAFRFTVPERGIDRDAVISHVRQALLGELALTARLAERASTYRRRRRTSASRPETRVTVDHHASGNATVIEVRAPDTLGLLHRLTAAFVELGLDVRHATVQTLGPQAIDTFYVRTRDGGKLLDERHQAEVERATLHAVGSPT